MTIPFRLIIHIPLDELNFEGELFRSLKKIFHRRAYNSNRKVKSRAQSVARVRACDDIRSKVLP